jgi:tetratricopeptide (TPR) repeat protein
MRTRSFAFAALAAHTLAGAAAAQSRATIDQWCVDFDATDAQTIAGCTADIDSGRYDAMNLAVAFKNRGLAYDHMGQFDRAIADYDEAIKRDPVMADAYKSRGDAYYDKRQLDRAIADYTRAIEVDPKFAQAYQNRSIARKMLGDRAGSEADLAKARQLDPRRYQ